MLRVGKTFVYRIIGFLYRILDFYTEIIDSCSS